ncbi:MAG: hypothetical protein LUQ19_04860 [Methanoregula sp.]|nr:hypothetical protein [Methanoregula sp.]
MRKIIVVLVFLVFILCSGCTSYFSNLTAPKHNLNLTQQAVFEKEGNLFTAEIKKVEPQSSSSRLWGVSFTMHVKNTGKIPVSLMAYPRLEDTEGNQYPGKGIYLNMLNVGGQAMVDGTIPITTDEASTNLKDHAVLYIRFQDTKLIPYEAAWDVDL